MRWWMVIVSAWMLIDCGQEPLETTIPARPANAGVADRSRVETFAIDSIFLGDVDRNGNGYTPPSALNGCSQPSSSSSPHVPAAWKSFGYDLDGKITNQASKDVCILTPGAPPANQVDGIGGSDNAWGSTFMAIAESIANSQTAPSTYESQLIAAGAWTLQIQTSGLPAGSTPLVGIAAQVFTSGAIDGAPAFDSTTDWPILASSTVDGVSVVARAAYDDAYVSDDGTFVTGVPSEAPIVVPLAFGGQTVSLAIHRAVVTFKRAPDDPTRLAQGTIAGVLETEEFITMLRALSGRLSTSLCGSAFEGIAEQIRQAQDILSDGTNASGIPCDAISIGLGFTARLVSNPTKIAPDPTLDPDPCTTPDSGADASGD